MPDSNITYAPIFEGSLPADVDSRWSLIRRFLGQWCFGDESQIELLSEKPGSLVRQAEGIARNGLSPSLFHWFDLLDSVEGDELTIRDCPEISPIESHFEDPSVKDATVILMQGEGDVFWAVPNDRFGDDDPAVDVYQLFDPFASAHMGCYASVSVFALSYLCVYNPYAIRNVEWFSADGNGEDIKTVQDWFQHRLVIQPETSFYNRVELLEQRDIAAIVNGNRIEVSMFCDERELQLPDFLIRQMKQHLASRAKFEARLKNDRADPNSG